MLSVSSVHSVEQSDFLCLTLQGVDGGILFIALKVEIEKVLDLNSLEQKLSNTLQWF